MRAIYLIARREFLSYVATWGFWLSLASVPLFMALGFGLPILIESSQPTRYYVMIDETGGRLDAAYRASVEESRQRQAAEMREAVSEMVGDNPQITAALDQQMATTMLDDGRYVRLDPPATDVDGLRPYLLGERLLDTAEGEMPLFAAIYLRADAEGGIEIEYWSTNLTDGGLRSEIRGALRDYMRAERLLAAGVSGDMLEAADSLRPVVRELNPERAGADAAVTASDRLPVIVAIGVAFALWIIIFSVVNMLLTAMIEEKGNKVLEMMMSSARHHEILTGKLFGVAAVSFTLLAFWGLLAFGGGTLAQQAAASANMPIGDLIGAIFNPGLLVPALGYFIIGYFMYGAVFLAVGSLCDTLQDAQTLMSPIMLVMMVPLFLVMVAADSPDSPIVTFASWVPVWTPFIMLARLPQDPSMMELVGTTGLMLGTAIVVIWGAGVMFRMGALNQANQETIKNWFRFGKKQNA